MGHSRAVASSHYSLAVVGATLRLSPWKMICLPAQLFQKPRKSRQRRQRAELDTVLERAGLSYQLHYITGAVAVFCAFTRTSYKGNVWGSANVYSNTQR